MGRIVLFLFVLMSCAQNVLAAAELKGTPEELTDYLTEVPKTTVIVGSSEL